MLWMLDPSSGWTLISEGPGVAAQESVDAGAEAPQDFGREPQSNDSKPTLRLSEALAVVEEGLLLRCNRAPTRANREPHPGGRPCQLSKNSKQRLRRCGR